jgi:hypothetical protein
MADVKIGIPSLLLCIEMAIFSVLHLWAFPWRVYDVRKSAHMVGDTVVNYPPGKSAYQGGFLGLRALWEAFNLWDMIKAFGRAVRWLFVGRKKRHEDISYKANSRQGTDLAARSGDGTPGYLPGVGADTSYHGGLDLPLQDTKNKSRPAHPPRYSSFEEGQELLAHAQSNPTITISGEREAGDIGILHPPPTSSSTSSLQQYHDRYDSPDRGHMNRNPNPLPYPTYVGSRQQTGVVPVDTEMRPYKGYYAGGQGNGPPRFPSPPER